MLYEASNQSDVPFCKLRRLDMLSVAEGTHRHQGNTSVIFTVMHEPSTSKAPPITGAFEARSETMAAYYEIGVNEELNNAV